MKAISSCGVLRGGGAAPLGGGGCLSRTSASSSCSFSMSASIACSSSRTATSSARISLWTWLHCASSYSPTACRSSVSVSFSATLASLRCSSARWCCFCSIAWRALAACTFSSSMTASRRASYSARTRPRTWSGVAPAAALRRASQASYWRRSSSRRWIWAVLFEDPLGICVLEHTWWIRNVRHTGLSSMLMASCAAARSPLGRGSGVVHDLPSHERQRRASRERSPGERRVAALRVEAGGVDGPARSDVERHDVGGSARPERAAGQPEHLRRRRAHAEDELRQRQRPALHELRVRHAERRLESHDPEGGVVERRFLLVVGVRGMVGGDAIDHAIQQGLAQRRDVRRLAQRRAHLRVRVVALARRLGETEGVRRHLRRDPLALPPRAARTIGRAPGRHGG